MMNDNRARGGHEAEKEEREKIEMEEKLKNKRNLEGNRYRSSS
jgi:hypothetical protein